MNVLIADDHLLFRETLVLYLERYRDNINVTLADTFFDVSEKQHDTEKFDIIILDLCMPGMDGLNGLKKCQEKFPDTPIIIMSGVAREWEVTESLNMGAAGFIPKNLSGKAFIQAVELVHAGERFTPVDYTPPPLHPPASQQSKAMFDAMQIKSVHLTPREQDVLSHLITGASNQDIADALDLKPVTIKLHIRSLCRKLSAKNRTQAALYGRELLQKKAVP